MEDTRHFTRLLAENCAASPIEQFRQWHQKVKSADTTAKDYANAMSLSTVSADGTPSSRIVFMCTFDDNGFLFGTSSTSLKGQELEKNPNVSCLFLWTFKEKDAYHSWQVRINGTCKMASTKETQDIWNCDNRAHKVGLSYLDNIQSTVADIEPTKMEEAFAKVESALSTTPTDQIPIPPHWHAFRITPAVIEFYSGAHPNHLNDRICYKLDPTSQTQQWTKFRLYPWVCAQTVLLRNQLQHPDNKPTLLLMTPPQKGTSTPGAALQVK